jgi:anti-anti-sigma regulatory factor
MFADGRGITLWIRQDESHLISIEGELCEENAAEVDEAFRSVSVASNGTTVLNMSAFDVMDGVGVTTVINAIRSLLERTQKIMIIAAPQMLAHNLYRVGMLAANSRIELVDMREDEPYG